MPESASSPQRAQPSGQRVVSAQRVVHLVGSGDEGGAVALRQRQQRGGPGGLPAVGGDGLAGVQTGTGQFRRLFAAALGVAGQQHFGLQALAGGEVAGGGSAGGGQPVVGGCQQLVGPLALAAAPGNVGFGQTGARG